MIFVIERVVKERKEEIISRHHLQYILKDCLPPRSQGSPKPYIKSTTKPQNNVLYHPFLGGRSGVCRDGSHVGLVDRLGHPVGIHRTRILLVHQQCLIRAAELAAVAGAKHIALR